jgi:hypothetical protein
MKDMKYLIKPVFLISLLSILSFSFLHAQFGRVAPKAGMAFSHLDNIIGGDFSIKGKSGFIVGADWRIEKNRFFYQPGLHLQHFNTRLRDPLSSTTEEWKSRITSAKLPLTAGWYVNGRRRLVVVHARAGLSPELILGTKAVEDLGYSNDLLNTFQLNGVFGLGVDLAIFTIDLSHEVGFTSMLQDNELYNRVTVLTFGLIF